MGRKQTGWIVMRGCVYQERGQRAAAVIFVASRALPRLRPTTTTTLLLLLLVRSELRGCG